MQLHKIFANITRFTIYLLSNKIDHNSYTKLNLKWCRNLFTPFCIHIFRILQIESIYSSCIKKFDKVDRLSWFAKWFLLLFANHWMTFRWKNKDHTFCQHFSLVKAQIALNIDSLFLERQAPLAVDWQTYVKVKGKSKYFLIREIQMEMPHR